MVPELARFAGAWGNGAWGGVREHVLIVEQVRPDGQARVVYAVGSAPGANDGTGYTRVTAHIEDDILTFKLRGGNARVDYRVEGESLCGAFTIGDRVGSQVTLVRTAVR